MKIKTTELEGSALDWAVAEAAGYDIFIRKGGVYQSIAGTPDNPCFGFRPSTRWDHCGPLIECFEIDIESGPWSAYCEGQTMHGDTPTQAACRAIVAAKLGDTVDVPEGLV